MIHRGDGGAARSPARGAGRQHGKNFLLGLTWGKKRLKRAYDEMTHTGQPILGATFMEFAQWWARHRAMARYAKPAMPAGVGEALVLSFVWSLAAATCAG